MIFRAVKVGHRSYRDSGEYILYHFLNYLTIHEIHSIQLA